MLTNHVLTELGHCNLDYLSKSKYQETVNAICPGDTMSYMTHTKTQLLYIFNYKYIMCLASV